MTQDAKLLDLWRRLKDAMAYELDARSQPIADQRAAKAFALENEIMALNPEGPMGEVIQLGLQRWGQIVPETERYRELVAVTGLDVLAELNALCLGDEPETKVLPFKRV